MPPPRTSNTANAPSSFTANSSPSSRPSAPALTTSPSSQRRMLDELNPEMLRRLDADAQQRGEGKTREGTAAIDGYSADKNSTSDQCYHDQLLHHGATAGPATARRLSPAIAARRDWRHQRGVARVAHRSHVARGV
mmetsp:Transcript_24954/g.79124  ORF Transcript_24954/g.79124 Transcript_24954/m.79124 type:complete len:136 (+) Transcript_24954:467-874(+)